MNEHLVFHRVIRSVIGAIGVSALVWILSSNLPVLESLDIDEVFQEGSESLVKEPVNRVDSLSEHVFSVDLWYVPVIEPKEVKAPVLKEQPVRLNIELMAITSELDDAGKQVFSAVIFDADADTIRSIRLGDLVASYRVSQITEKSVELKSGNRVAVLELELLEGGS